MLIPIIVSIICVATVIHDAQIISKKLSPYEKRQKLKCEKNNGKYVFPRGINEGYCVKRNNDDWRYDRID